MMTEAEMWAEMWARVTRELPTEQKATSGYSETGACLCTSLSQTITPNDPFPRCVACMHDSHNSRVHCGALR